MPVYDLYGSNSEDIEYLKELLESTFGSEFIAHESSYHGEYFLNGDTAHEHFILKLNQDPIDNECVETNFTEYKTLLYVNDTRRSEFLHQSIQQSSSLVLLRHENLD